MMPRLRDLRRLARFKAEQRAKRRQQPSPSEASCDDDADAPAKSALWAGLTGRQAGQAQALLDRAIPERGRLIGPRYAARIAGIKRAVLSGVVGDSAWGRRMLACRGGRTMKLHGPHILKAIAPAGARASVIARGRRKAAKVFDRKRTPT